MNQTVIFNEYGGPEILQIVDAPLPTPQAGQVRIRNRAAGLQPFDALFRSGALRERTPATFPQGLGNEFAGVVDALGDGVESFKVGNEVLGWTAQNAYAQALTVPAAQVLRKPAALPWAEAAALTASGQTAATALDALKLGPGDTLLIHAAAGGVGTFAAQLARAAGARVIGTARAANHAFLRELGAEAVEYGPGLEDRIRALAPGGVSAALIAVGTEEAFRVSQAVTTEPGRMVSVVFHPLAARLGVRHVATERSLPRLQSLLDLHEQGHLRVVVQQVYPLAEVVQAHRTLEGGHVRGKLVLEVAKG